MGTMAFKIDLEKAYDSVDWNFLRNTLCDFGFSDRIINLFMSCVSSSSLSILWNGNKLDSFHPTRGLCQGNPMSPYLFFTKAHVSQVRLVMDCLEEFYATSGLKVNIDKSKVFFI